MRSISKKIAFGDNLKTLPLKGIGRPTLLDKVRFFPTKESGSRLFVGTVVRKVFYTFLHHKIFIRLRRKPRLRAETLLGFWHYGVQARAWPWMSATLRGGSAMNSGGNAKGLLRRMSLDGQARDCRADNPPKPKTIRLWRRRVHTGTAGLPVWCSICTGLLCILIPFICSAQNQEHKSALFQGEINANNINIRSDSTVNSKIICIANKGEPVEVIRESYGWFRVRLPKTAPSFIKKDLVALIDEKTAKVIKDNVNIRLNPDESSPILGKTGKNEVINILEERGEWYKIEPLNNSFGWIHKKFVNKADTINKKEEVKSAQEISAKGGPASDWKKENKIADEKASQEENATIEGIIKPYGKVIKRTATHKLITVDNAECSDSTSYPLASRSNTKKSSCIRNNIFLLKGNKGRLDSLNYHKVRVTGKLIHPKNQKRTIIEILKIESLD